MPKSFLLTSSKRSVGHQRRDVQLAVQIEELVVGRKEVRRVPEIDLESHRSVARETERRAVDGTVLQRVAAKRDAEEGHQQTIRFRRRRGRQAKRQRAHQLSGEQEVVGTAQSRLCPPSYEGF